MYTVPGNHDSRNVGYVHFEDLIGPRTWSVDVEGVRIVGMDSSEPDQNEGKVGRGHYEWIREQFSAPADLKVFAIHHHLLPIPGTGRERSTVMDAGDLLEVLLGAGAQVVLSGHKHVPYVWCLENMYIANAGTVSSLARARLHEALLQRAGVPGGRGQDPPEVPVRRRSRHGAFLADGRTDPSGTRTSRRGTHRSGRRVAPPATTASAISRGGPSQPMRIIVLVDGEHYPPVTRWGIDTARERGHEVVGALLVGGNEKLPAGAVPDLGVPTMVAGADRMVALTSAIDAFAPEGVLDLSDEPVLGYRERMELASVALARGIPYLGADFRLDPPIQGPPMPVPTLAVIGTGKRTGKTAVVRRARAPGGRARSRPDDRRDGPRRSRRAPGRRGGIRRPRAAAGARPIGRARGIGLPGGCADDGCDHDRRATSGGRPGRCPVRDERPGGRRSRRGAGGRHARSSRGADRRSRRCPGTRRCSWCRRRSPSSTWRDISGRSGSCCPTWWLLLWLPAHLLGTNIFPHFAPTSAASSMIRGRS